MKLLDIALKDLLRSFRNAMFLVFGLLLPLLTAGLFYFAFGGSTSDGGGFELPQTQVIVVNLDQASGDFSAGEILLDILREAIPGLLHVSETGDWTAARQSVDRQEAAVAILIPAEFSTTTLSLEGASTIEIFRDPTLTMGPDIVSTLVRGFVDALAGSRIAASTTHTQLSAHGIDLDARQIEEVAIQYAGWISTVTGPGSRQTDQNVAASLFHLLPASKGDQESSNAMASMLGQIMAGMMVFYVFFTGAATAQSILQEEEAGTLPRLFTTPTSQVAILGGKFTAAFALLTAQVFVLVLVSSLAFAIDWGPPRAVALVTAGLVILASSFGIFITSFLKDTRQSGIIYGGVMTVMGMVGMIGVFTAGAASTPLAVRQAALLVPQGWAIRGWQLLLDGADIPQVLLTVSVMLAAGAVFFAIGVLRFRKRYA
jgi:ABC-2 type transport system permease protein